MDDSLPQSNLVISHVQIENISEVLKVKTILHFSLKDGFETKRILDSLILEVNLKI